MDLARGRQCCADLVQKTSWRKGPEVGSGPGWGRARRIALSESGQKLD